MLRPSQVGQGVNDVYLYSALVATYVSVTDVGVGADINASSINASLPVSDSGTGVEGETTGLTFAELGTGVDSMPSVTLTISDACSGVEAQSILVSFTITDLGTGLDLGGAQPPLFLLDFGHGSERFAIRVLHKGRLQYTVRLRVTENVFDPSAFDPYAYE